MSRLNLDTAISVQYEPTRADVAPPFEAGERFRDHLEPASPSEPSTTNDSRPEPSNARDSRHESPPVREDRQPDDSSPAGHDVHNREHTEPTSYDEPQTGANEDHSEETGDEHRSVASDTSTAREFGDHLVSEVTSEKPSDQGAQQEAAQPIEGDANAITLEQVELAEESDPTPLLDVVTDSTNPISPEETANDASVSGIPVIAIEDELIVADSDESETPAEPKPTNLATAKTAITNDSLNQPTVEAELPATPPVDEEQVTSPTIPTETASIEEPDSTNEPVVAIAPNPTTTNKERLAATTTDENNDETTPRRDSSRRVSNRPAAAKTELAIQRPTGHNTPANSPSATETAEFRLQSVSDPNLATIETGTDANSADGNRDANAGAKIELIATPSAVDRAGNARMAEKLLGAAATRPEGKVELRHVDQARFVQRVAGAIARAGQRDGEIHLRLSPPELGSLRLQIRVEEGALTARMEAENSAARGLILENLPTLRDRLAEQNIRIERFEVELGQQNQAGADQSHQHDHTGRQHSGSHEPGSEAATASEASDDEASPAKRTIAEKQINVVV